MHWTFKKFTKNQLYSLFGPNQFNDAHKWTVNAATALLWHAIRLRFDKHMSWLVIFLLERGWITEAFEIRGARARAKACKSRATTCFLT